MNVYSTYILLKCFLAFNQLEINQLLIGKTSKDLLLSSIWWQGACIFCFQFSTIIIPITRHSIGSFTESTGKNSNIGPSKCRIAQCI